MSALTTRRFAPVAGGADGQVLQHVGRYAREAVLTAFEMIGGVERLADWADKHPDDYFTKLFPKVITREVDVGSSQGVEELLRQLDAKTIDVTPTIMEPENES